MTAANVPSPVPPPIRKMIKIWYLTASTGSTPAKIWPVIIPGSDTSPAAAMLLMVGINPARMASRTTPRMASEASAPSINCASMAGLC